MEQSNIVLKQLFLYGYHHRFYLLQNKSLRMKMDETPTDGILAFQSLRNNLRWPCYLSGDDSTAFHFFILEIRKIIYK